MWNLFALLMGILNAVAVTVNGKLSGVYGLFTATVLIHAIGGLGCIVLLVLSRQSLLLPKGIPLGKKIGGVVGIFTVLFSSIATRHLPVTAIVALCLLGESITAVVLDHFGLFGLEKRPMDPCRWLGFGFSIAGIAVMLYGLQLSAIWAVAVAFGSGITVNLSRAINAQLARVATPMQGCWVNHFTGLLGSLVALLLLGRGELLFTGALPPLPNFVYFIGGLCGVGIVTLGNVVIGKIPTLRVTLLVFIGQVFMGIAIDSFLGGALSKQMLLGGCLVMAGMVLESALRSKLTAK